MYEAMYPQEELETRAFAIACDEQDDVLIGWDVRRKDWSVLLLDPDCSFSGPQCIVEARTEDAGLCL